ncbi:MAG: hypothetical protein QXG65_00230 [Thermoplasmata archaeon]
MATDGDRWRRLGRILEGADYQVADRPEGIVAWRPKDRRALILLREVRTPHDLEPAFPPEAVHRIAVYPSDPGPVARSLASERAIEILDPTTLGPALGELLLGGDPPSPVGGELPLEPPLVVVPQGDRYVVPRLTRDDLDRIVPDRTLRRTLRAIPYFVAPYRVRIPAPHGGPGEVEEHLLAVHGLDSRVEAWEGAAYELSPNLPEGAERIPPVIGPADAGALALEWIRSRHTVRVDHTEQLGGTVVVETRRVSPGPDDVRLGAFALVHLPLWYCEGPRGRILVNAATGAASDRDRAPEFGP